MATALQYLNVPLPIRGMNTDASPSQISPEYAPYLRNMILEPNQLRARQGWIRKGYLATLYGTPADGRIGGVAYHPHTRTAIINAYTYSSGGYEFDYLTGEDGGGPFGAGVVEPIVHTIGTGAPAAGAGNLTAYGFPVGRPLMYDGTLYYINEQPGNASGNGKELTMWGGSNAVNHTAGGVTLNNGSKVGTFSSAPAYSVQGMFLKVTGGATGPGANYRYSYRITQHSGGSGNFLIERAYGQGESTTNVPNAVGASTTIIVSNSDDVAYAPEGVNAVALFRGRLFVGGGFQPNASLFEFRGNLLNWSYPDIPQKWPSANFAPVGDSGDRIMGLATVGEVMLILLQNSVWVLSGYDENSFSLSLLADNIGCAHSGSICYYGSSVIWADLDDVYMFNGSTIQSLMAPTPGVGIQAAWQEITRATDGAATQTDSLMIHAGIHDNTLFLSAVNESSSQWLADTDAFVCDLTTGAWTRFGNTVNSSTKYQPNVYFNVGPNLYAVTPWQVMDISGCYAKEGVFGNSAQRYDEDYSSAGATLTTATVAAEVRFADLRLASPHTARLRGVQIEHNCHYYNASSSPRVAWAVTLDVDSEIDTTSTAVGNVDARWIGNVSTPAYHKYYVDRFTEETFSTEGAVFRLRLTKSAITDSAKIFRVDLVIDSQAVMVGRVDNATT